jgi:hypothetical protein
MGKYSPLEIFLKKQDNDKVNLSFSEIEDVLNDNLPPSAYKYEAWWSNGGHHHANSWLNAEFFASVDINNQKVEFTKHQEILNSFVFAERIHEFNQRWNISKNSTKQNAVLKFKNRFQNIIGLTDMRYSVVVDFCNMAGVPFPLNDFYFPELEKFVCKVFRETETFEEYIMRVQMLFWALEKSHETERIDSFYRNFSKIMEMSPDIEISSQKIGNQVLLYPSGAKLLDEKIVNTSLQWLINYPEVLELFEKSLIDYQKYSGEQSEARTILDGLRASLEKLLKSVLKNDKTLENNAKEIKLWLQKRNVHPNIINSVGIFQHIKHYIHFMNDVKHANPDINYSKNEIEHMIYQTGIFIRLIIKAETNE